MGSKEQRRARDRKDREEGANGRWPSDSPDGVEQVPVADLLEQPSWPAGIRLSEREGMTCTVPRDLAVVLSPQAFQQLFGYAYSTPLEISCLGLVRRAEGRFRIEGFHLVKQTCTTGHTELEPQAVASLVEHLLAEGKADEAAALKCWAHSHPTFGLFWSRTDEATCARLVTDWLVSVVVGQDFALRCRIDVGGAVPFTIDHVPVLLEVPGDERRLADLRAETARLVAERVEPIRVLSASTGVPAKARMDDYCAICGWWHKEGECLFDDRVALVSLEEGTPRCRWPDEGACPAGLAEPDQVEESSLFSENGFQP